MSLHAISWAMKQPVARSSEKFVLVCLANYASENGTCYPSVAALESDTGQDRKTVIRGLQSLVSDGWIVDTGKRAGVTKQIPVYRLIFDNDPNNGTVDKSSPKSGTVPETEQSQFSVETVPFFPENSTVFPDKGSQKRDTDTSGTIKEPSRNRIPPNPPPGFVDFWQAYPNTGRKVDKAQCLATWLKDRLEPRAAEVLGHLMAIRETNQWKTGYEPAPLRYLRNKRYEDPVAREGPVNEARAYLEATLTGGGDGSRSQEIAGNDADALRRRVPAQVARLYPARNG